MRIIETDLNDIEETDLNESKINIANEIISFVYPLLRSDYKKKIKEIQELKISIEKKHSKIKSEKTKLQSLSKELNKKHVESKLLKKMGKLIQTGLVQDKMKKEMVVLLNSFEHLQEDKITTYLNETIKIISQKFAKR
jgi:septal ring factor EnvC (AmiA/AmiB activator)